MLVKEKNFVKIGVWVQTVELVIGSLEGPS